MQGESILKQNETVLTHTHIDIVTNSLVCKDKFGVGGRSCCSTALPRRYKQHIKVINSRVQLCECNWMLLVSCSCS